ncbi:MAG: aldo/keto reductase, partial [Angustibacter sp.]
MEQRYVGRSGLQVSRLGLGTMTWGQAPDEHEAREQLGVFAAAGGTLVDTAAGYGGGTAEEILGALWPEFYAREELVLCSKAAVARENGQLRMDLSRRHLLANLDCSLRRLGTDHLDLWLAHAWSDAVPLEETLSALSSAVA